TGDATGTFNANELRIAPKETVAKDTVFTVTYNKVLDSMTTAIDANYSPQNANGVVTCSVDLGAAIEDLSFNVILSDKQSPQVMIGFGIESGGTKLFVKNIFYPSYQSVQQYAGNTVISDLSISWMPYASGSGDDWQPTL